MPNRDVMINAMKDVLNYIYDNSELQKNEDLELLAISLMERYVSKVSTWTKRFSSILYVSILIAIKILRIDTRGRGVTYITIRVSLSCRLLARVMHVRRRCKDAIR